MRGLGKGAPRLPWTGQGGGQGIPAFSRHASSKGEGVEFEYGERGSDCTPRGSSSKDLCGWHQWQGHGPWKGHQPECPLTSEDPSAAPVL